MMVHRGGRAEIGQATPAGIANQKHQVCEGISAFCIQCDVSHVKFHVCEISHV